MTIIPISSDKYLNGKLSAWLHILRWSAAFTVMLTHAHDRIIIPLAQIPSQDRSLLVYLWSFISGFGHMAVVIFFVLSGYLVGGTALIELLNTGNIQLRKYFINRLTRLYVVLLPALLIGGLLDSLGNQSFPTYFPYQWATQNATDTETLACNLAFLQTVLCQSFGTNRPLWSLTNVFWYYMIWPLMLSPFMYKRSIVQRSLLFAFGILIIVLLILWQKTFAIYFIVPYMLIWCIGVIPIVVHKAVVKSPTLALGCLCVVAITLRVAVKATFWEQFAPAFIIDTGIALVLCAALTSLVHTTYPVKFLEKLHFHKWFADYSFSLYVLHMPVVTFLSIWLLSTAGLSAPTSPCSPSVWAIAALITIGTPALAYLFSLLAERHTKKIREWCYRSFNNLWCWV